MYAKLTSGTNGVIANTVYLAMEDQNIQDKVTALSFNTTSSDTGRSNGACTLIESALKKDLLYLA